MICETDVHDLTNIFTSDPNHHGYSFLIAIYLVINRGLNLKTSADCLFLIQQSLVTLCYRRKSPCNITNVMTMYVKMCNFDLIKSSPTIDYSSQLHLGNYWLLRTKCNKLWKNARFSSRDIVGFVIFTKQ